MTGSGKTTFALRYLLNVPAACRFVFDDLGQVAARLGLRQAGTAAGLEAALASRWVVFNPHRMFPGQVVEAFAFFCQWAFAQLAQHGKRHQKFIDGAAHVVDVFGLGRTQAQHLHTIKILQHPWRT